MWIKQLRIEKNKLIGRTIMGCKFTVLMLLIISISSFAQDKKQCILQIDNHCFSKEEFQNIYKKNNSNLAEDVEMKTPAEYMDMFVNFKLKVLEAERLGYDTVTSFVNELKGYRNELAQPYLTDIQFDQQMVEMAYYRTKHERKASHILINTTSVADTLKALKRILEIRKKIEDGADFGEMALQYSEDPSAKQNKGELGYFCGGMMVFPFEDAAFKTPVGEMSMPVKTKFGYHLIKVEGERESKGQISVAHIMKHFPQPNGQTGAQAKSRESVKREIDSLYVLLKNGADFEELAKKYSDDQYSAGKGGKIQPFNESRMVPAFAEAAFALQNDGDISPVVETPYGWHIIKRLKHFPVPEFDEIKDQLTENIKKNPQISKHSRDIFVSRLKKEYGFVMNEESKNHLLEQTSIEPNTKKLIQGEKLDTTKTLFGFDNKQYTVGDFIHFVNSNGKIKDKDELNDRIDEFAAANLIKLEDSRLEQKYPEFRMLVEEYHDGILLFNISEKMIWNKASEDTLGLNAFYQKNKGKYLGEEQFKGWIINCKNIETRSRVDEILGKENITKEELFSIVNSGDPNAVSITEGVFQKGQNPVVDYYVWNAAKPDQFDEVVTYVRGDKLPPAPKSLEESRGQYVADYQNEMEQNWLNGLRKKYKITINKKLLKGIPSLK